MKNTLEELQQEADHLRFKIKRFYYKDQFYEASRYEYELEILEKKIEELKRQHDLLHESPQSIEQFFDEMLQKVKKDFNL